VQRGNSQLLLGVIIFYSVWFLLNQIIKSVFIKQNPVQTDWFWFDSVFSIWFGFFRFGFFFWFWVRFNFFGFRLIKPNTTRKLINTNGNTEGIFSSVHFRGILPTAIFPRYIPTELSREKNLKQSKKKRWPTDLKQSKKKFPRDFYQRNYRRKIPSVNCEHCSLCQLQRESPTEFSVGIFQKVLFDGFLKKFN